jgi:hypothetical protein
MLTEASPSAIASRDHELAISRLESFGSDLRSATPPPKFNPRDFAGIELIRVAANNIKVQVGINKSLEVVRNRLEASLRFEALQSIEQPESEPKVFDSFTAGDISHLTFFYGAFHRNIERILGSDVVSMEAVKALALKHEEEAPKIPPTKAVLTQRRESVIDKLQSWLVDPSIDQKMEQLLPDDNEGDDIWLFMDSIKTLDGQLGLKHGVNIKDFFRRNLTDLGSHTYNVDFSKRGHGVVQSGSNAVVDESSKKNVEEDLTSKPETAPSARVTVIFKDAGAPIDVPDSEIMGLNNDSDVMPEFVTAVSAEPLVPKPKAVEQRDPDIRQKLGAYLDDVMSRPEFTAPATGMALNRVFNALKKSVVQKLIAAKAVNVPSDKDGHHRFDPGAIATLFYIHNDGEHLPSQLKKQVQDIADEEYRRKIAKKEDPS